MEFARGFATVIFLYAVAWGVYQWGYMNGVDSEAHTVYSCNEKWQACNRTISGVIEN